MFPHLPAVAEHPEDTEPAALFERAHKKFGPSALPLALRRLGRSPVLFRDAILNLEHVLSERPPLSRRERLLLGIGIAAAVEAPSISSWLDSLAEEIPHAERRGAIEAAFACRTLNAYYRGRSLVEVPGLDHAHAHLRASPLVSAGLPKRTVELLSTAVSVAMACRSCATAHARAAMEAGATLPEVDEVIRLQAVLVALAPLDR